MVALYRSATADDPEVFVVPSAPASAIERWVTRFIDVTQREQPVERVVFGGDEAVEAGGGVELDFYGSDLPCE